MNVSFYCINFNDENRKMKMINRFEKHGIELQFVPSVYITDSRLESNKINNNAVKRNMSIMLQHLDSIRHFYENTTNDYLILCEDDILISKNMMNDLPSIIDNFKELKLDVLLLGYLINFKLDEKNNNHDYQMIKKTDKYIFYEFPYNLWGSQMYLMNRNNCEFLLNKYTMEYALADLNRPYSPDWTLTKDGKKALIYPMIALEEGVTKTDDHGQNTFHNDCFKTNYDETVYY
jgi:hypothetical protein